MQNFQNLLCTTFPVTEKGRISYVTALCVLVVAPEGLSPDLPPIFLPHSDYNMCVWQLLSHILLFATPWTSAHQTAGPLDYSNKNIGVGSHSLLQGIFLTKGSNPSLLHQRQILYCLSFQGSPAIIRLDKRMMLIESFYPHLGFPQAKHKEWVSYNAKCDFINILKLNHIISVTFIIFRVSCRWIYCFNVLVLSF